MIAASPQSLNAVAAAVEAHLHAARQDPAAFATYVLRDERTGRPIELAPMHCEWHDLFDRHQRLVLWAHIEAAKTSTLVGRVLWALGKDPSTRIGLVSNTATQAEKVLRSVARYIQRSAELQQVFPHLRPGDQWTNAAITVQRPVMSKDPSVQAFGVHGAVLGARLDLLIRMRSSKAVPDPDDRYAAAGFLTPSATWRKTLASSCWWTSGRAIVFDQ